MHVCMCVCHACMRGPCTVYSTVCVMCVTWALPACRERRCTLDSTNRTARWEVSVSTSYLYLVHPLTLCVCQTVGPYCEYKESGASISARENCRSFDQYLDSLLEQPCRSDDPPGVFTWTPDDSTPDTVYYQVMVTMTTFMSVLACLSCHLQSD